MPILSNTLLTNTRRDRHRYRPVASDLNGHTQASHPVHRQRACGIPCPPKNSLRERYCCRHRVGARRGRKGSLSARVRLAVDYPNVVVDDRREQTVGDPRVSNVDSKRVSYTRWE